MLYSCLCPDCGKEKTFKYPLAARAHKDPCRYCASKRKYKKRIGNDLPLYDTLGRRCCLTCKTYKELIEFSSGNKKIKFPAQCTKCRLLIKRVKRYNLTLVQYFQMVEKQKSCCAICMKQSDNLFIDHNHETGKVRALLCDCCNAAIGLMKENIDNFYKAIIYLNSFKEYHN